MRWKQLTYYIMCAVGLTTCMIEDDIPYPMVVSEITEIAVEGQCAAPDAQSAEATIDKKNRTVNITVNDSPSWWSAKRQPSRPTRPRV